MRYDRSESFARDYRRLSRDERSQFREAALEFSRALDRRLTDPGEPWPKQLRIKGVTGAPGVWELTWNFSGPDGRATWDWLEIDGEPAIRWRRVGDHSIFANP